MSRSGHPLYLRRGAQAIEAVNVHLLGYPEAVLDPPRDRTDFRVLKLDLAMADDSLRRDKGT